MDTTLSVKAAAAESTVAVPTILGWIHQGKITANKIGGAYFVDRESLNQHLASRSAPKATSDINSQATAAAALPDGQAAAPVAPVDPTGVTQHPDFRALAALPANDPQPPASKTSEPVPRLPSPSSPPIPNPDAATATSKAHVVTSGSKNAAKGNRHEADKAFKKGPVRYAKDAMRKFDLEQLRDIRTWILHRMDLKSKSV